MTWPSKLAETWKDVLELAIILAAAIVALIQLSLLLQQSREQQQQRAEIARPQRSPAMD